MRSLREPRHLQTPKPWYVSIGRYRRDIFFSVPSFLLKKKKEKKREEPG